MRGRPFSEEEQESYARSSYYLRTVSVVASVAFNGWLLGTEANRSWAKSYNGPAVPEMDWGQYLKQIGVAFVSGSFGDIASQVNLTLTAAGMLSTAYQLWNGDRTLTGNNPPNPMVQHFTAMSEQLDRQVHLLGQLQKDLAGDVKQVVLAKMGTLSKQMGELKAQIAAVGDKIDALGERAEIESYTNREHIVLAEIRAIVKSCTDAARWAKNPESQWPDTYMELATTYLNQVSNPDFTGAVKKPVGKPSVGFSTWTAFPHYYIGLIAQGAPIEVPSVPVFNAIAESLVQVGNAALARKLEPEKLKAILKVVDHALREANLVALLARQISPCIRDASAELKKLKRVFNETSFQEAMRASLEGLNRALVVPIKTGSKLSYDLATGNSRRFTINRALHEKNFNYEELFRRLKEHFKFFRDRSRSHVETQSSVAKGLLIGGAGLSVISFPLALPLA
ncbi:MAG TPA: hypothetical protein VIJ14_08845, partial [Rhabdochlamydiaceae bacterium]